MSLSLKRTNKNSKKIANMHEGDSIEGIYLDDLDNVDKSKVLKTIRINNSGDFFFPTVCDIKSGQVDRYYVCGPSGCGKSTFIRNYVIAFSEKYPQAKIFLFSSKLEDKALDDLGIVRIPVDEDLLTKPIGLDEISARGKPSLCIFDDIQDFKNRKINVEIARLRDEIMRNGRSYGIFSIYVWHDPCDFSRTKSQILESNKVVIFPRKAGVGIYDRLMTTYLHLPKEMQKELLKMKSSYVIVSKEFPTYVMSDKYIMLV